MHIRKSRPSLIIDIVEVVVFSLLLSWGLRSTVVEAREVPSVSMLPTIQVQDRLLVDKLFFKFSEIKRGDIVVFDPPSSANLHSEGQQWIKRVIALPGESVEIKNGKVFIDGKALAEPYELEKPAYRYGPSVVPRDSFFVLGDNRNDSLDSHYWGVLPAKNVVGRAVFRYWPFVRFGTLAK